MTSKLAFVLGMLLAMAAAAQGLRIDQLGFPTTVGDNDLIVLETAGVPPAKKITLRTLRVYLAPSVSVACGSDIQTAINNNNPGTTFNLAGSCTYNIPAKLVAKNNITLSGAGYTSTILDGGNGNYGFIDGLSDGHITGVTIRGVAIQHFGVPGSACDSTFGQPIAVQTWDGWVITNSSVSNNAGRGITLYSAGNNSTVSNSLISNNGYGGINASSSVAGDAYYITGNEVSFNNQCHGVTFYDVAGLGKVGADSGAHGWIKYNYVHDNLAVGIWTDVGGTNMHYIGNTVIHNSFAGIMYEISSTAEIANNVVKNSTNTCYTTVGGVGGCPPTSEIYISSSDHVYVHDNNVLVPGGLPSTNGATGIQIFADNARTSTSQNIPVVRNTITFTDNNGGTGYSNNGVTTNGVGTCTPGSGSAGSPTCSQDNHFFIINGNTSSSHFYWDVGSAWGTNTTFSSYRTATGQDSASTFVAGDGSVAGCLQIGCTGP